MNQKKLKYYIRLYWVRIIVIMVALFATILLVVILYYGLRAWFDSESYLRQTQLAQTPMQV
ncbi:MAG: hypothetical protein NTZ92_03090, partial [Candidatus Omnitrophica bacterium]|nr:hypothetical protein [Candidatus Omnitrophota bacterium]